MTLEQLTEIEARCDAASQGPWGSCVFASNADEVYGGTP